MRQKSKSKYDRHHRRPQSLQGDDSSENISIVKIDLHRHWHGLFSNKDVPEIVRLLNKYWVDPSYTIYYKRKEPDNPKQLKLFQ